MFKRLVIEDWQQVLPVIAFSLTFGIFLVLSVRALLMKRSKADYMAHLPLGENEESEQ